MFSLILKYWYLLLPVLPLLFIFFIYIIKNRRAFSYFLLISIISERLLHSSASALGMSNSKLIFLVLALFYFMVNINNINHLFTISWRIFLPLIIFVLYFTISTSWGANIRLVSYISLIGLFVLSYLVLKVIKDLDGLEIFISVFSIFGTAITTLLFFEYFTQGEINIETPSAWMYRASGSIFSISANNAASFTIFPIIFYYVKYFLMKEKNSTNLFFIIYNFIGLILTVSLSAIISLLIIVLIGLVSDRKLIKGIAWSVGLVFSFALVIKILNLDLLPVENLLRRFEFLLNTDMEKLITSLPRISIWDFSLKQFYENPIFGYGFQSFTTHSGNEILDFILRRSSDGIAMHNYYILLLFEGGVVGMALFLFLIIRCLSTTYKIYNQGKMHGDKVIEFSALTLFLYLIHYIIKAFFHDILVTEKIPWVLFGLVEILWISHNSRFLKKNTLAFK